MSRSLAEREASRKQGELDEQNHHQGTVDADMVRINVSGTPIEPSDESMYQVYI